ncbi:MAG: glycosylasparaginase, partial [Algoriphagus sp.]|nr:glycosylasparaginase [Algoriphagus sp.]
MSQRRKFIKQSLVSSALFLPGVSAFSKTLAKELQKEEKPLILSTWNHGLPANKAAGDKLK